MRPLTPCLAALLALASAVAAQESPEPLADERRADAIAGWKKAREEEKAKLIETAERAREEAKFRETAAKAKVRYQAAAKAMEALKKDRWQGAPRLAPDSPVGHVAAFPPDVLAGTGTVVRVDEKWGVLVGVDYVRVTGGTARFVPDGTGGGSVVDVPVRRTPATWRAFLLLDGAAPEPGRKFRPTPDLYHVAGYADVGGEPVPVLRPLKVKPEEMPQ
jgi:hypothetical protein